MKKNRVPVELIIEAAENSDSMVKAAKIVGLKFTTFIRKAKALGVYRPNQSGKGVPATDKQVSVSYQDLIAGNHKMKSTPLKNRLFSLGLKEKRCEGCGLINWRDNPITLELEHKDGDHFNNKLDNLEILCPNCHSQTPTFKGKNIRSKGEKKVSDEDFVVILAKANSIHSALRELGYAPNSGNYIRAYELAAKNNLINLIK